MVGSLMIHLAPLAAVAALAPALASNPPPRVRTGCECCAPARIVITRAQSAARPTQALSQEKLP
ncbi:MAG: hypothetical protein B7Z26_09195 [Asticcacaulis sp. 32-58-5]|nr:MAG: hypothetical protein B7Z26_09195 [Asticcacaulis sp. 32-58-5]